MTREFNDFIDAYEKFKALYPEHPLMEDLRSAIFRRRLPSDEWLRSRTLRMKRIMRPPWLETDKIEKDASLEA